MFSSYLFYIATRNMKEGEQKLKFNLRLQDVKTLSNVPQNLSIELRTNRTAGPEIVTRAEFVMKPQRGVTVSDVGHFRNLVQRSCT